MAGAAVATVAAAAMYFFALRSSPPAGGPLDELNVTQLTSTGNAGAPAISPDGKCVAYV